MRNVTTSCLLFALLASGCARHVALKVPATEASPEERMQAYAKLAPTRLRVATYTWSKGNASGSSTMVDSLKLAGGQRVYDVADLLPAIHPESDAANDIARAYSEAKKASYTFWGGLGAILAGSILMGVDLASSSKRGVPFYAGATLGVGGIIAIPVANVFGRSASEARDDAFKHYDEGLLQRLDLCRHDEGVAPCH